jgi:hypothetical protein
VVVIEATDIKESAASHSDHKPCCEPKQKAPAETTISETHGRTSLTDDRVITLWTGQRAAGVAGVHCWGGRIRTFNLLIQSQAVLKPAPANPFAFPNNAASLTLQQGKRSIAVDKGTVDVLKARRHTWAAEKAKAG